MVSESSLGFYLVEELTCPTGAKEKASDYGFALSCELIVGRFLALLAAKTPNGPPPCVAGSAAGQRKRTSSHYAAAKLTYAVDDMDVPTHEPRYGL